MDFTYGRVTYHHVLDTSHLAAHHYNNFVYKITQEFQKMHKKLVSSEGMQYSYQNPENFLHHLRLYFNPEITAAFVLICGLGYFSLDNAEVTQFLQLLFQVTGQSPLVYRIAKSNFVDAYEFDTYSNSLIFNTASKHPGDPRVFSQSY